MKEKVKPRIVIDDRIRHGKPIITGTRITVDEVLGALIGGTAYDEIESEYGIEWEDIEWEDKKMKMLVKKDETYEY